MASFRTKSDQHLAIIVGVSIAVHGAIAVIALMGDPPEPHTILTATSGRAYVPDVEAEIVFDASNIPDVLTPGPTPPPAVAPPAVAPPAPVAHPGHRAPPVRLPDPRSTQQIVDGMFADEHGLGPDGDVSRRRPGTDLAHQIDEAKRHGDTATIGGGDPRVRGGDTARIGTAPDCHCLPGDPTPTTTAPPTEIPPVIHVRPDPTAPDPTTLGPDEVLRIITTKYMAGLERCQTELLRRAGDAHGKVTLELTIDDSGATVSPLAAGVDDDLDRCVEARAGGWRFPVPHSTSTGAAVSMRYRLSLALQSH